MRFDSINDASTWYTNSGYSDWEWFDGFDEDELVKFAYLNCDGYRTGNELVAAFLKRNAQDPADYGLANEVDLPEIELVAQIADMIRRGHYGEN